MVGQALDPVPVALRLWQHTRVNGTATWINSGAELGSATATEASQQGPAATLDPGVDTGNSGFKTAE